MMDERAFKRLAEIASAVGASPRFAKILSDASLPAQAKIQLINDVTKGALGDSGPVVDALRDAFTSQRPAHESLADHMLLVAAGAGFDLAGAQLGEVENGLRSFVDLVKGNTELRFAMTNPGISDDVKKALVGDLLANKTHHVVVTLLQAAISITHGNNIDQTAIQLADLVADRLGHVVADVRTAIELDPTYKSRLTAALTSAVGRDVQARFIVDPSVIGSVVVRVGDEVWDGSVRQRLEQARIALTGTN